MPYWESCRSGTLNHFARDLRLPPDIASCVRLLKTGTVRAVDVAEVNGRPFLNNSGLGLYPSMVTQREKRRRLGQPQVDRVFPRGAGDTAPVPLPRCAADGRGARSLKGARRFVFVGNNVYRMEGFNLGSRESLTGGQLCLAVAQYRIGTDRAGAGWRFARYSAGFARSAISISSKPRKFISGAGTGASRSRSTARSC